MQQTAGIQLSLFGKTLRERFLQMTGWILQPCSVRSQVPRFQCLLVDGHTPEWCEGDALIPLGDCWTPSIGENPPSYSGASACSSWRILQVSVPEKYYLSPGLCSRFLRLAVRRAVRHRRKWSTCCSNRAAGTHRQTVFPPAYANYGTGRRSERVLCQLRTRRRTVPNSACECNGAVFVLVRG